MSRVEIKEELYQIVYVDIHQFNKYNDEHGHVKGDKLIDELMEYIESQETRNLKRISGNKFTFEVYYDVQKEVCDAITGFGVFHLKVGLNFAVGYASEDRKDELMYLLKVASNSGGYLTLRLP